MLAFSILLSPAIKSISSHQARSPTDASLLAIGSLSLGEVPTERSEDEARS